MEEPIYIYGRKPIEEALTQNQPIEKIFIRDDLGEKTLPKIFELASKRKIPITRVPERKLQSFAEGGNDQGIVGLLGSVPYLSFDEWIKNVDLMQNPLVLVLDEIEDPYNMGAIIRTAVASGVSGIIVGKHRQAPVSGVVYKTSAGTVGKASIVRVSNTNDAIRKLKDAGFWTVSLDMEGGSTLWNQDFQMPIACIVGNEGKGVREKTQALADFIVSIPMQNGVESLNASVSTALVMYEWARQNKS